MDEDAADLAIVLRTRPNSQDEMELLAYLQSLCDRREAAAAQPLLAIEPLEHTGRARAGSHLPLKH